MNSLQRLFLYPVFKSSLRRFEKNWQISPRLIQIETLILKELSELPKHKITVEIRAKHLYLNLSHEQKNRSILTSVRLVKSILKTRGKLRWLCFRLMPTLFSDSYEIGRGKLMFRALLNWDAFRQDVLDKLFISKSISGHVIEVDSYEYTHPNMKFEFSTNYIYLLGGELAQDLNFGDGFNSDKKNLRKILLANLIVWDSSAILNFIRLRDKLWFEPRLQEFLGYFPDLKTQISHQIKLQIKVHLNASLTFDERKERGQLTPDVLQNVAIWHQRFIIQQEIWHIVDSTSSPYSDFVAGHWQFLESIPSHLEHIHMKKPDGINQVNLEKAIFLLGRADENWYHLLLDTLPRYLELKNIEQDVPVLMRSDLPDTTISIIKSLISHPIIFVAPNDVVTVEKLFFFAARSTIHDSQPTDGQDQVHFSPQTLKELRDWVLERLDTDSDMKLPSKIFIPRRAKYRNLINGEQLRRKLEFVGFKTVETNSDFYLQQYCHFNQANLIVSPGGAVLANIVFMKPGSSVCLIRSWRDSDLQLWKKLAESCEVHFSEAIGIPTYYGRKTLARQHSNYFIPTRRVGKLFKS